MNKFLLYIKHLVLMAVSSKLRFFLIFIGTLVGVYIYATGNLILDSIYYAQEEEIRRTPDNAFFVLTEDDSVQMTENMISLTQKIPLIERISSTAHVIYEEEVEGVYQILYARIHGINKPEKNVLVHDAEYGVNLVNMDIISGRNMTLGEIENNSQVCVIDEYTAGLLFGNDNPIGKTICFNQYNGGVVVMGEEGKDVVYYKIVGVSRNNFYTERNMERNNKYSAISIDERYIFVNVFCPYNYYLNIEENEDAFANIGYTWNYEFAEEAENVKTSIENDIDALKNNYNISSIIDKEYKYNLIKEKLDIYDTAINIATIILFVIMGVSCMSIIFFAMKERVYEIGVKKAFGASVIDIVFQFWLENLLIIVISVIVAVFGAVFTVVLCEKYIVENIYRYFEVYISKKNIILPILFGVAQGVFFTSIPCIRYSMLSVVRALKLEK